MVFIFFGLVATVGTVYLQTDVQTQEAWIAGAGVGLFAVAVLVANNLRDIPTDTLAGKKTLSVRIGDRASRILYVVCVLLPFVVPALYVVVDPGMVLVWFVLFLAVPCAVIVLFAKTAKGWCWCWRSRASRRSPTAYWSASPSPSEPGGPSPGRVRCGWRAAPRP